MKQIRSSSPQEAVLTWLKAELNTKRSKDSEAEQTITEEIAAALTKQNANTSLITNADLTNKDENELRLNVLRTYRNWMKDDLDAYNWQLVELSSNDVAKLHYIDYSYWNELSRGTHQVGVGAATVQSGITIFNVPNDTFWSIANAMKDGQKLEPIIVLKDSSDDMGRIIEGHARSTAYMLLDAPVKPLMALIGTQKTVSK